MLLVVAVMSVAVVGSVTVVGSVAVVVPVVVAGLVVRVVELQSPVSVKIALQSAMMNCLFRFWAPTYPQP